MRQRLNLLTAVFLAAIIAYLSLVPVFSSSPGTSLGISLFALGHFGVYLGLGFLLSLYLQDRGFERPLLTAVALSFVYGASMELLQAPLSYRFFGFDDLLYNGLGAGLLLLDGHGYVRTLALDAEAHVLEVASTFNVRPSRK